MAFVNSLGLDLRIWDEVAARLASDFEMLAYDKRGLASMLLMSLDQAAQLDRTLGANCPLHIASRWKRQGSS